MANQIHVIKISRISHAILRPVPAYVGGRKYQRANRKEKAELSWQSTWLQLPLHFCFSAGELRSRVYILSFNCAKNVYAVPPRTACLMLIDAVVEKNALGYGFFASPMRLIIPVYKGIHRSSMRCLANRRRRPGMAALTNLFPPSDDVSRCVKRTCNCIVSDNRSQSVNCCRGSVFSSTNGFQASGGHQ